MTTIRLIIAGVILTIIGLAAWGVKHAIDTFAATAAENASLKLQKAELETSLREEVRTGGILLQVARSNTEVKQLVGGVVGKIQGELRDLKSTNEEVRKRAELPVPSAVQQRLSKWPTDSEGYPILPRPGPVDSADKGTGSEQPNPR